MTALELTLATLVAVLWVLGAYSTYAGIMIAHPIPGRLPPCAGRAKGVASGVWLG